MFEFNFFLETKMIQNMFKMDAFNVFEYIFHCKIQIKYKLTKKTKVSLKRVVCTRGVEMLFGFYIQK